MELRFTAAVSFTVQAQQQRWVQSYVILCLPGARPYFLVITVQVTGALHGQAVSLPEPRSLEGRVAALLLCLRHLEKHDRLFSCKADPDTLTWFEQGLVETGDAERSKKIVFCRLATGPRKPRVPVRAKDCVSEGGPLSRPTRRPPTLWHVVILGPEQPRCALGSVLPGPTFSSTRKRDLTAVSGMRLRAWTWILPVAKRAPNDPGTSERRLSPAVVNPSSPGQRPLCFLS